MYAITLEIKELYEMNPKTRIRLYGRGIELDHPLTVIELVSLGRSVKFCIKVTSDNSTLRISTSKEYFGTTHASLNKSSEFLMTYSFLIPEKFSEVFNDDESNENDLRTTNIESVGSDWMANTENNGRATT